MSKQYWLNKYTCEYHLGKLVDADIHVIEYKAYEKLESALKRANAALLEIKMFGIDGSFYNCVAAADRGLKEIQDLVGDSDQNNKSNTMTISAGSHQATCTVANCVVCGRE